MFFLRVGVESFLRGNLQVQFGGRRASTLPYEYSDYNSSDEQSLTFDSYTIPEDDLELGQSRLLEVDNRVVLPAKSYIRFIVTSADVPHSWAVPSLGVKCDAVPGRLNQTSISVQREGVYYGDSEANSGSDSGSWLKYLNFSEENASGSGSAEQPANLAAIQGNEAGPSNLRTTPTVSASCEVLVASPLESSPSGPSNPERGESAHESSSWTGALRSSSETGDTGTSVNQGVARPVLPANPVVPGEAEAGPSHVVHFPYDEEEVIGGDCVLSIRQRLLGHNPNPSAEAIYFAQLDAQDLFEIKVDIVRQMSTLDPTGDWLNRGARALDNPRTLTGEESLGKLHSLYQKLQQRDSETIKNLQSKMVFRREDNDAESIT